MVCNICYSEETCTTKCNHSVCKKCIVKFKEFRCAICREEDFLTKDLEEALLTNFKKRTMDIIENTFPRIEYYKMEDGENSVYQFKLKVNKRAKINYETLIHNDDSGSESD